MYDKELDSHTVNHALRLFSGPTLLTLSVVEEGNIIKTADEQKPPSLEELVSNYFWNLLRRKVGSRLAVVIFVMVSAVVVFRAQIAEVASVFRAQVIEWLPLPKADPNNFTVAIVLA